MRMISEGLKGAGQGLAASIDGAIPFFDALENLGVYNERCFGLAFSKVVGGASLGTAINGTGILRGVAALATTRVGRLLSLNSNRYFRIGPGKMPGYRGAKTPRISIGNGTPAIGGNHFSLLAWGW